MRRQPGDNPVLARRPRVPKTTPVLVPRGQRERFRAEHQTRGRSVDGRLQAVLLQRGAARAKHPLRKVSILGRGSRSHAAGLRETCAESTKSEINGAGSAFQPPREILPG